jgi:DNA-binding LacI/PurR family transcriptional regulator
MGKMAGKQILALIADKSKPRIAETITVDTYLINGETTRVL